MALHDETHSRLTDSGLPQAGSQRSTSQPERIGPYRILETLGEGGMGVVYLAEQGKPIHRRVALKIIKLGMDTKQVIARFETEREALALMSHPNVAKVLDAGATAQGRPYFVMEHVQGIPITDYCDRHRLDTEERLRLFIEVCHAVQHAHQKGIIHRDLKPSNVLVTIQDDAPVPKVIDFGVAKATQHRLTERTVFTEQGQLIGTPGYMSPEQAEMTALDIDTRTDIYSLGVMLYELLVGALPFDTRTLLRGGFAEIQRIIREVEPARPSTKLSSMGVDSTTIAHKRKTEPRTLVRQLRGDLDWIVMKCLEKDRTHRYDTANALALEIHRHLMSEPVLAGPPRASYRLAKFIRRNRGLVAAGSAIVVALAIGLGISLAMYTRAERERSEADRARIFAAQERDRAVAAEKEQSAQRERAEQAEVNAVAQAKRVSGALDFIRSILGAADPHESGSKDTRVRDVLEKASDEIDTRGELDQESKALVHQVLGRAYRGLGMYPRSKAHLDAASALATRTHGEVHPDTAAIVHDQGWLIHDLGDFPGAERTFRRCLEIRRATLGPMHADVANTLAALGDIRRHERDPQAAKAYFNEALDIANSTLGPEHRQTVTMMNDLGLVHLDTREFSKAETLFRKVIDTNERLLGKEHAEIIISRTNLADTLWMQGRTAEATALYKQAITQAEQQLGRQHPRVARFKRALGRLLLQNGEVAAARAAFVELIEAMRGDSNWGRIELAMTLDDLAQTYIATKEYEQARQLLDESLAITREVRGEDHIETVWRHVGLAKFWQAKGDMGNAEREARLALAGTIRIRGARHVEVAWRHAELAHALVGLNDESGAISQFEAAVSIMRVLYGDDHEEVLRLQSELLPLLEKSDRANDAAALRDKLYQDVLNRPDEDEQQSRAMIAIVFGFVASKQFDKAEQLFRRIVHVREKLYGFDATGGDRSWLASVLISQKKWAEAEPFARSAATISLRENGPRQRDPISAQYFLSMSLIELGRFGEAEETLQGVYAAVTSPPVLMPEEARETAKRLVHLYVRWDKRDPGAGHADAAAFYRSTLDSPWGPSPP